ncbi:hypothetical protein [Actinobaculum sp. 352]|uniref:hypothetical protein n=1 Tax=Actinobaculum sp. 352 TaxID=2490946 RepID=UPI000F7F4781|nr:hypothetical protein [Actinobaculum sp. 352]RTE49613.1 hypothetical protein EKN07_06100 [Actinobaculum sp. 352]
MNQHRKGWQEATDLVELLDGGIGPMSTDAVIDRIATLASLYGLSVVEGTPSDQCNWDVNPDNADDLHAFRRVRIFGGVFEYTSRFNSTR